MQENCCTSNPAQFVGFWRCYAFDYVDFLQDGVTTNEEGYFFGHEAKIQRVLVESSSIKTKTSVEIKNCGVF